MRSQVHEEEERAGMIRQMMMSDLRDEVTTPTN